MPPDRHAACRLRASPRDKEGVRRRLLVAVAVIAGALPLGAAAPPAPAPRRIMSMMQCTDLLLLSLVPKARIASVTHLAHAPVQAIMPGRDRGIAVNHGTAEDILRSRPDLILAGTYSTPAARRISRLVGAPLREVGPADSFADVRATTRRIARAVGEPARGEAAIARMDATLRRLAADPLPRPVRVVAWSGSGRVAGRGTLTDEIIRAAGGINIAAEAGDGGGSFDAEALIAARPDAILQATGDWQTPSLNAGRAAHPLVQRLYRGRRIGYPGPLFDCGLPQSADAAAALHAAFRAIPAGGVPW